MPHVVVACLLAAGALAVTACASALPIPTDDDVAIARTHVGAVTRAQLLDGRARTVARCSGCHTVVPPSSHRPSSWPGLVREMTDKANRKLPPSHRIDDDERKQIEAYLVTMSIPR